MCILSYLPAGVAASDSVIEGLMNGGISNGDGHGWAIVDAAERRIITGKSMVLTEALDSFADARDRFDGPALFHSRWATHGNTDVTNVHPFAVGGSPLTVVAHNGILPYGAHPAKGDPRSDTRLFADEILSTRYRRLDKPRAFEAMTNWIGSGNKLVILTVDPRYRHNAYIVNEKRGNWDKSTGVWHSNYDYVSPYSWRHEGYTYGSAAYGSRRWMTGSTYPTTIGGKSCALKSTAAERIDATTEYARNERCYICEIDYVNALGYCTGCATCQDCLETENMCQCWDGSDYEARQRGTGRAAVLGDDDGDDEVIDGNDSDKLAIALRAIEAREEMGEDETQSFDDDLVAARAALADWQNGTEISGRMMLNMSGNVLAEQ